MVVHLLRYDDFSACSHAGVEEKLAALFLKHRVSCTFGVVPFACDPAGLVSRSEVKLMPLTAARAEMLRPLLREGLAEIALHGYAHLSLAPVKGHEEFSERMPLETQRRLIRDGRDHLESIFGVKVRVFVPPWNRLSASTVPVLQGEGLMLSSGGPEAVAAGEAPLGQLPCPTSISATRRALDTARRTGQGQNCVGTLLHDYDFKESNLGVADFTLAEFEDQIGLWKNAGTMEHKLISDTISPDRELEGRKARANLALRQTISASRLRRKFGAKMFEVYWDAATADRLDRSFRFIP